MGRTPATVADTASSGVPYLVCEYRKSGDLKVILTHRCSMEASSYSEQDHLTLSLDCHMLSHLRSKIVERLTTTMLLKFDSCTLICRQGSAALVAIRARSHVAVDLSVLAYFSNISATGDEK